MDKIVRFNILGRVTASWTYSTIRRGAGAAGLTGEIAIWSNDSGGLANLGATIADKSIADGALVSTGPSDTEIWENADFQERCIAPVVARIPDHDLRDPLSYAADEDNWFNPLRRYCHATATLLQRYCDATATLLGRYWDQTFYPAILILMALEQCSTKVSILLILISGKMLEIPNTLDVRKSLSFKSD